MQPNEIIEMLWRLGHFINPAHPTGVTLADLPRLKLTDKAVKIAIQSYQEFMAPEFDRLSLLHHSRIGIADGEVGPATIDLFAVERCGYPDYTIEAANGSGSWPANCRMDTHPNIHTFSIQVDKSGMPAFLKDIFEDAFSLVQRAYADMGMLFLREDNNPRANTLVTWQRGAGWIGLAIVPQSPQCGERIWARFDNRYQPSDLLNQWSRLLAHELGHNQGMGHSRGGIMNPTITSGPFTPTAWRGDSSESIVRRYFSGIPVKIPGSGPDVPPPPGSDGDYYFEGDFTLRKKGDSKSYGKYILKPKPEV